MRDLIYVNGQLFDGRHYRGAGSVAVRDGRIVAVGDLDDVRAAAAAGSEEVDLEGGLLLPGFQDAHMHPMVGGLELRQCELTDLSSKDEYLEAISRDAAKQAHDTWFRGGGWSAGAFDADGPTAAMLDAVLPDRPAFIPSSDHHNAWVNSKAMEIAGIDASTPDPPDGWLVRDEQGNPTGCLREAAMALVQRHVTTSRQEYAEALKTAQSYLAAWGITGWHDALIGGYAGLDDPTQAYLDLLDAGELTARVRASQWWDRHRGVDQVHDLVAQRDALRAKGLDAGSVKLMVDGISETFTAAVTEPYQDLTGCPCGDRGLAFLSPEELAEAVVAVDAAGLQAHFHAIGDRAVHSALDALEQARRTNGANDLRHQVAHLQLVRPEDRARFRALGVTANVEGTWAHVDTPAVELLAPHLDEERIGWHYPFADIVAAGAGMAGGSDWPVNPPNPVHAVHVLVNRRAYSEQDDPKDALCPEQAVTPEQAFAAYTNGSAYVNHSFDSGQLQVGMRADLAVLDRDPFAGPTEEIGAATVRATYVAGQLVHAGGPPS